VSRIDKLKFRRNEDWIVVERNNHQIVGLHFTGLRTEASNKVKYHRFFKLELFRRSVTGRTTLSVTTVTLFGQNPFLGSISPTFYSTLLRAHIPKRKKTVKLPIYFYAFGSSLIKAVHKRLTPGLRRFFDTSTFSLMINGRDDKIIVFWFSQQYFAERWRVLQRQNHFFLQTRSLLNLETMIRWFLKHFLTFQVFMN